MAKKQPVAENHTIALDNTVKRVKKDLLLVAVCAVISVAGGLAIGSMIKF